MRNLYKQIAIATYMKMIWRNSKQLVKIVDLLIFRALDQFKLMDKVRIAMFITWIWAVAGLYATKLFESVFKLILKMPDEWLHTSDKPKIAMNDTGVQILFASDGKSDITNKFKLFLKYYWEKDDDSFSFQSLQRLMSCSMLYCIYMFTDKNGDITPDLFWKNADKFFIELKDDKCVKYSSGEDTAAESVPFGAVSFANTNRDTKRANDKIRHDLLNFIDS